jgi:chorismate mutase-like protein
VAIAKFLSGQPIDDDVREQQILESAVARIKSAELRHALGIEFFLNQLEANIAIQRGLRRYWRDHPEEAPVSCYQLTAELRPAFDIVNMHMLLLLTHLDDIPPVTRRHIDGLFQRRLRTSTALRQLTQLRRDAADIALRSVYRAL